MKFYIAIFVILIFVVSNFGQTGSNVDLAGRLFGPAQRRGVSRAVVSLNNPNGEIRTTQTNAFGYFRFGNVQTGIVYTIDIRHKVYTFAPLTVDTRSNFQNLNFDVINFIAVKK